MLGSFVRAIRGYNPFGKVGELPSDNAGDINENHMNYKDVHHRPLPIEKLGLVANLEVEINENGDLQVTELLHYDLCPVDSCVNLLSALDSRNGVMSMRTSPHSRALLINNNPCGQQFS